MTTPTDQELEKVAREKTIEAWHMVNHRIISFDSFRESIEPLFLSALKQVQPSLPSASQKHQSIGPSQSAAPNIDTLGENIEGLIEVRDTLYDDGYELLPLKIDNVISDLRARSSRAEEQRENTADAGSTPVAHNPSKGGSRKRCPGPQQHGHPLVYESHCDHGQTEAHDI